MAHTQSTARVRKNDLILGAEPFLIDLYEDYRSVIFYDVIETPNDLLKQRFNYVVLD